MENEIIKQLLEFIKSRWHRKSTLALVLIVVVALLVYWFSAIDMREISFLELIIGCIVLLIFTTIWVFSNRLPKPHKGRVGFVVAIIADNQIQQESITKDFVQILRELINRSKFKYRFELLELPAHLCEKIESSDDAIRLLHEMNCHFMVYGRARTIKIKGETQHVLSLEGAVTHTPIPVEMSKTFSVEFSELFPRELRLSAEGDLFSFQFTAKLVNLVARYIIGVAAMLSGDVEYAEELFENLRQTLVREKIALPALVKIKDRLPLRLRDIYIFKLSKYYDDLKHTKDLDLLNHMEPYLLKLQDVAPENITGRLLRSIWIFLRDHNVSKAKTEILKARNRKQTTWRYNYAFLLAYEGNLEKAAKEYDSAFRGVLDEPAVALDVVEFIMWILELEPNKTHLNYCLGLIYYYAIKDYVLALQGFEKFVDTTSRNRFPSHRTEAEKIIMQIKRDIKSGKINVEN